MHVLELHMQLTILSCVTQGNDVTSGHELH
jgi:hypothetical protein